MKRIAQLLPWVLMLVVAGGIFYYYNSRNSALTELLRTKEAKLMQANLSLGRANTKIGDANAMIDTLNKKWKGEIKKRQATLTMYAELEAKYKAEKKKVKTLTKVIYKDRTVEKIVNLPKGKLFIRQEDGTYKQVDKIRWTYKDFRITMQGDCVSEELNYELHQKFRGRFVESTLPGGGKNHYAEIYELDDKGKDVGKMELDRFDVIRSEDLPAKMWWWNPKVDLGAGAGANHLGEFSWSLDLGWSISAYGRTPDDISWRLFRLGVGVTGNGFSLTFSPAQYNLGKNLPLISNMWLTPYGGYDFSRGAGHFGLGISVVF